jgi:predicted ATPase/DNA-binding XRE family transcriptional regulator
MSIDEAPEEISFGEWLRQRRRMLDLTQQALADQVGCARITLRRIESGGRKPSKELAQILLSKLGVPEIEWPQWIQFARSVSGFPVKSGNSFTSKPLTNLPASLTSFIGREKEQAEILTIISKYRLITLVGSGGVGKTRLSSKVGEQVLGDYAHGVWLVELAPILDPLLVPRTTAISIGLYEEPKRPIIDMLCDYLREKKMLIILDNCEHLVAATASMADQLLRAAPNLRILASSREALGLAGEVTYRVPSLRLPDMRHLPSIESLSQYEAVQLFIDRAASAVPAFKVKNEDAPALVQICHHLDGIPLAIELAAAKVRVLSLEQINKRLDDRFHLLTGEIRTALPQHQTLRAAIDWSYDLLSPAEQILFQRLSVFVNGWTLEAAESVCSDTNLKSEDVLDLLIQLINKSLVNIEELQNETGYRTGESPRYRMLETIRQYANEKLADSGNGDALRDKHLEYFVNFAETAKPHLRRAEQIEWLKQLDAEYENLRSALAWAMDKPSAEPGLRLASALSSYWNMREYFVEGAKWLDQALKKEWDENKKSEKAARARALYGRADFADLLDELDVMKTSAESALALCKEVEDTWGIAYSHALLATHLRLLGDNQASKPFFEQSLNEFQRLGDAWGESFVSGRLVGVLMLVGRPQNEYRELRQRAIARARISGDRHRLAESLIGYANNFMIESQWDQAEKIFQEAEQLLTEISLSSEINQGIGFHASIFFARGNYEEAKVALKWDIEHLLRIGERSGQADSWNFLELIAEIENDPQSAVEYAQKSLDLMKAVGSANDIALCLSILGRLKYWEGSHEVGLQYVRDSLEIMRSGDTEVYGTARVFGQIGGMVLGEKPQIAVQLLGYTEALWRQLSFPRSPIEDKPYFERFLTAAHEKLSEDKFATAWEAGWKMTVEEAIELALKTIEQM